MGNETKVGLKYFGLSILIFLAVIPAGEIMRGDMKIWLWQEIVNQSRCPTLADQIICVCSYAAFYSMGFFIPFWVTTFILFLIRQNSHKTDIAPSIPQNQRVARIFISLSILILYLCFLESIVAFIRTISNGWLSILGLGLAAFFAYAAYIGFRSKKPNS
jgi:hypothetical protein